MAGTIAGGQAAAATIKAKDPDFYKRIGASGGKVSRRAWDAEAAAAAGRIGGARGRRTTGALRHDCTQCPERFSGKRDLYKHAFREHGTHWPKRESQAQPVPVKVRKTWAQRVADRIGELRNQ